MKYPPNPDNAGVRGYGGASTGQNAVGPWATAQPDIGAGPTADNPLTAYMRPGLGGGLTPPPDRGQQLDAYKGWLQSRNDGGPVSMEHMMPPEWMNAQRAQRMQERIAGRNQPQKGGQPAQAMPVGA